MRYVRIELARLSEATSPLLDAFDEHAKGVGLERAHAARLCSLVEADERLVVGPLGAFAPAAHHHHAIVAFRLARLFACWYYCVKTFNFVVYSF